MSPAILRCEIGCQCGARYVFQDVHAPPDGERVIGELKTFARGSGCVNPRA